LTIFRDGAEVWNGILLPGEDTQYRDPSDQSGLYVKLVSGETSSRLCPNASPAMGGPQPISVFIVHADRPASTPWPPIIDRPGSLIIFSVPAGATVFLDGGEEGTAPVTLTGLAAGPVSIRAEKDGYAPWEKEVTVFPGARILVTARLEPLYGNLRIQSFPSGADISLDGQSRGTTPLVITGLDAGAHTLLAEKPGYTPYEREVTVIPGRDISLYLRLSPESSGAPLPL
ncbi:MAG: PEGA domain-containing protein, partial [Methanomicrobiales archaeon]|nr:PEGA domain-containing protein [Methanomicrobiales archaeon]